MWKTAVATNKSEQLLFWACFAVAVVDGFDTLVVAFIAQSFGTEFDLSNASIGHIFGAGLAGAAIGGVIAGSIADRFGRKKVLIASVILFTLLTFVCAMAPSSNTLLLARFIAGLGLGGAIPTITALTAEKIPHDRRMQAITRMFLGFPLGAVAGGAICSVIVEPLGWRSAFWLGGLLGLALLPGIIYLVNETLGTNIKQHSGGKDRLILPLVKGRTLSALFIWLAALLILLTSYFLINWLPSILSLAGMSSEDSMIGGTVLNLGGVFGAIILTFIFSYRSPFVAVPGFLLIGAIVTLALGYYVGHLLLALPLVFICGMSVIGGQLNLPALSTVIFPAAHRASGIGWTMGIGRLGSIIGPTVGGLLIDQNLPWEILFLLIALLIAASGIAIFCAKSFLTEH